jgi:methionyl-tRNA formyltransferase
VLEGARLGCLNLHASLLPRWRGAAPIQRAILAGDAETGVDVMRMEAGLDTGAVLAEARTAIGRKTAGELTGELAGLGAGLIVRVLADLPAFPEVAQAADGVTYAKKIDKAETRLDFALPAGQVERQVRAFAPAPGAWFELDGERYKVLAADVVDGSGAAGTVLDERLTIACGVEALRVMAIQRAGKPVMDAASLLRGRPIPAATVLA